MECGRNAGANSGTALSLRTGSLAGLRALAICLRPLRPGAFVGSHARLAITGLAVRDLKVAFLLAAVHVGVKLVLQFVVSRGLLQ